MVSLDDYIGKKIILCSLVTFDAAHKPGTIYEVTLHGVEAGGIWIESEILTDGLKTVLARRGSSLSDEKMPAYFVPYAQIVYIFAGATRIDEDKLGL